MDAAARAASDALPNSTRASYRRAALSSPPSRVVVAATTHPTAPLAAKISFTCAALARAVSPETRTTRDMIFSSRDSVLARRRACARRRRERQIATRARPSDDARVSA